MADAGAAASDQSDLSRSAAGGTSAVPAECPISEPNPRRRLRPVRNRCDGQGRKPGKRGNIHNRLRLSDRLRRPLVHGPARNRRPTDWRCHDRAHPIYLYSCAQAAGNDASRTGVEHAGHEPAPQRQYVRGRRPGDVADPQLFARGRNRFRHDRFRRMYTCVIGRWRRIRGHHAGKLDRPAHAGRPVSRPAGIYLRGCRASLGALRRLWHERRHCRRGKPVLDVGGCAARLGRY